MTNSELTELLRRHVAEGEPGAGMPVDAAIRSGRRAVRRRRFAGGIAAAAVAVAAVAVVPHAFDAGTPDSGIAPATRRALKNYDAARLPQLIDDHVRNAVAGSLDLPRRSTFYALDDQGVTLAKKYWDKASQVRTEYDAGTHRIVVGLTHARSEAEGNARRICADMVAGGYDYTCTVARTEGGVASTSVSALVPSAFGARNGSWSWTAITRRQVARGVEPGWLANPSSTRPRKLDPDELWFSRSVKVVHSATFVTTTTEYVHARSYTQAMQMFAVPVAALASIASDPALVIPEPPTRSNGCPWMLHPKRVSCHSAPRG